MDTNVFFIILLATVMHAVWNGMVKKHPDKVVAVSGIVFGHVPASIIAIILLPAPSLECIPYIIASALIHQGYNWYLLSSYKIGDLTKVYPIARGFGPLVATLISILILGLVLDNLIILSIFLICAGIMILGIFDQKNKKNSKIIQYSLITGFFIGLYSIVDGYGARISLSAITYMSWSFILIAVLFPIVLKIKKQKNILDWGNFILYNLYYCCLGFYKSTNSNGRSIKRNKHTFYYVNRILFLKGEDHTNKNLLNINDIEWGSSTKITLNMKYFTI